MIAFQESRSARESWMGWLVLAGGMFALVFGLTATLTQVKQAAQADKFLEDVAVPLFLVVAIAAFCIYLFVSMRLEVKISDKGISYRFLPFIRHRHFSWDEITFAWVRKYRAIGEYGGWGYRGIGRRQKAYTMGEKYGIQLITSDGKEVLLGTLRPEAAEKVLRAVGKGNPPTEKWPPQTIWGIAKK